nr:hypothetical protein [Methyloceanibacter stevinii]
MTSPVSTVLPSSARISDTCPMVSARIVTVRFGSVCPWATTTCDTGSASWVRTETFIAGSPSDFSAVSAISLPEMRR